MATTSHYTNLRFSLVDSSDVYAAGVVFPILCTAFALLRFYTRLRQRVEIGLDDWFIVAALVCEARSTIDKQILIQETRSIFSV